MHENVIRSLVTADASIPRMAASDLTAATWREGDD
jgi:hypothetical protein